MQKVKVKVKKIALGDQDEGITEMFNQMIGAGDVNLHIAWPKYRRIKSLCLQLCNLFEQLELSPPLRNMDQQRNEIHNWVAETRALIATIFCADLASLEWNLALVDEDTHKKFSKIYSAMKESDLINSFVIMCNRVVDERKHFIDINKLDHRFVLNMAGVEWKPFLFTSLNYKSVFATAEPTTITLFMIVLHKMFKFTHDIYREIQTPDVDIEVFVDTILNSIDKLRKVPELSRCGEAFNKLKESVALLKNNFGTYYQDFLNTKDSSIIMQHFVMDVGNTSEAGPVVARQFMTIVNYYRKMTDGKVTDERLKMLLDRASKSFAATSRGASKLDKMTPAAGGGNDNDDYDDVSGDDGVSGIDIATATPAAPISVDELDKLLSEAGRM